SLKSAPQGNLRGVSSSARMPPGRVALAGQAAQLQEPDDRSRSRRRRSGQEQLRRRFGAGHQRQDDPAVREAPYIDVRIGLQVRAIAKRPVDTGAVKGRYGARIDQGAVVAQVPRKPVAPSGLPQATGGDRVRHLRPAIVRAGGLAAHGAQHIVDRQPLPHGMVLGIQGLALTGVVGLKDREGAVDRGAGTSPERR
ncbi:hypothetical protein B7486_74465, partial [cyanobacterium TDX16]